MFNYLFQLTIEINFFMVYYAETAANQVAHWKKQLQYQFNRSPVSLNFEGSKTYKYLGVEVKNAIYLWCPVMPFALV